MQKSIGSVIILIAAVGIISSITHYKSSLSYAPQFIDQQRMLGSQGDIHVPEANLMMLEKNYYSNINKGFYISLILLLAYSIPGCYLVISRSRKPYTGSLILFSLAMIDFLAVAFIKGSSDSGFSPSILIIVPVSMIYFTAFIVVIVSRTKNQNTK